MSHFSKIAIVLVLMFCGFNASKAFAILSSGGAAGGGYGGTGGGWSFGANFGFINATEKDMNSEIDQRSSVTGVKDFGNAWEVNAYLAYRYAGSDYEIMLRPSYFFYTDVTGLNAEYGLKGYTIFPMMRIILLESTTIQFYTQFGIGWGQLSGKLVDNGMDVKFSGSNIGYIGGLGALFCVTVNHCINVEGNLRYLPIDRNIVDSSSGSIPSGSSLTQIGKGSELETNSRDFGTSMTGILGMIGYTYVF